MQQGRISARIFKIDQIFAVRRFKNHHFKEMTMSFWQFLGNLAASDEGKTIQCVGKHQYFH